MLIVILAVAYIALSFAGESLQPSENQIIADLQASMLESKESTRPSYKFFTRLCSDEVIVTILVGLFFLNKSLVAFKISLVIMVGDYILLVFKVVQG